LFFENRTSCRLLSSIASLASCTRPAAFALPVANCSITMPVVGDAFGVWVVIAGSVRFIPYMIVSSTFCTFCSTHHRRRTSRNVLRPTPTWCLPYPLQPSKTSIDRCREMALTDLLQHTQSRTSCTRLPSRCASPASCTRPAAMGLSVASCNETRPAVQATRLTEWILLGHARVPCTASKHTKSNDIDLATLLARHTR
jgi:hypothetical protein